MTTRKDESKSVQEMSFAESAMPMGGKTEEEAKRTGAVDRADDEVEALLAPQYKTSAVRFTELSGKMKSRLHFFPQRRLTEMLSART